MFHLIKSQLLFVSIVPTHFIWLHPNCTKTRKGDLIIIERYKM